MGCGGLSRDKCDVQRDVQDDANDGAGDIHDRISTSPQEYNSVLGSQHCDCRPRVIPTLFAVVAKDGCNDQGKRQDEAIHARQHDAPKNPQWPGVWFRSPHRQDRTRNKYIEKKIRNRVNGKIESDCLHAEKLGNETSRNASRGRDQADGKQHLAAEDTKDRLET